MLIYTGYSKCVLLQSTAMKEKMRVGIIGGGLMGREAASAFGRWFVLESFPVQAELVAVCDLQEKLLDWFRQVPTVKLLTKDHQQLLSSSEVDVVYVAVPHNLHEKIYLDVLGAGKDLLAEKPFGIDLTSARTIAAAARSSGRFVRCSSEFPFLPGPQRVIQAAKAGKFGRIMEIHSGFWHSSDMDPTKPVNWKRQVKTCGEIGVMGDLGMHAVHVPFRLGWKPARVYAQLQKIYTQRPDGKGGTAGCDTWDNAILNTEANIGGEEIPMRLETKRLAPGETNTWFIEVLGTEAGMRYSTKDTKALWLFERTKEQAWQRIDLGHQTVFPMIPGGRPARTIESISETVPPGHVELLSAHPNEIFNLTNQLSLPLPEQRARAAVQLGRIGFAAADALPLLNALAREDPDDSVRRAASEAVLNIRGYDAPAREFADPRP